MTAKRKPAWDCQASLALAVKPEMKGLISLEPLVAEHAAELFPVLSHAAIYTYIADHPPVSVSALAERYRRLESRCGMAGRFLAVAAFAKYVSMQEANAGFAPTVGSSFFTFAAPLRIMNSRASSKVRAGVPSSLRSGNFVAVLVPFSRCLQSWP